MRTRGPAVFCGVATAWGLLVVGYLKLDQKALDRFWSLPLTLEIVVGAVLVLAAVATTITAAQKATEAGEVGLDDLHDRLHAGSLTSVNNYTREQHLRGAEVIPLSWSLVEGRDLAGPVVAAVGRPGSRPDFQPLPTLSGTDENSLRAGGDRAELFAAFAGLASGRLIVMGPPGSGKTGAGRLLMLDLLEFRPGVPEPDRSGVPVPIWTTAAGWDGGDVHAWLAGLVGAQVSAGSFGSRRRRRLGQRLVDAQRVTLILDGLDEMPADRRAELLAALGSSGLRTVLLSRVQELDDATRQQLWVGAAVVELNGVSGTTAAGYLDASRSAGKPARFDELLAALRAEPHGELAQAVGTPLVLTLIRDVYGPDRDAGRLLDLLRDDATRSDLEGHLLSQLVEARYGPRAEPGPYSPSYARKVLVTLARQVQASSRPRDLLWMSWCSRIPHWPVVAGAISTVVAGLGVLCLFLLGRPLSAGAAGMTAAWAASGWLFGVLQRATAAGDATTPLASPPPVAAATAWRVELLALPLYLLLAAGGLLGISGIPHGTDRAVDILVAGLSACVTASDILPNRLGLLRAHFQQGTPVRMGRFLQDATERGVLRRVGPVFQFRHATLQDQLANEPVPGSTT